MECHAHYADEASSKLLRSGHRQTHCSVINQQHHVVISSPRLLVTQIAFAIYCR